MSAPVRAQQESVDIHARTFGLGPARPVRLARLRAEIAWVSGQEGDGGRRGAQPFQRVGDRAKGAARQARPLVHNDEAAVRPDLQLGGQLRPEVKTALERVADGADRHRDARPERGRHDGRQSRTDAADADHRRAGRGAELGGGFGIGFGVEGVEGVAFGHLELEFGRERRLVHVGQRGLERGHIQDRLRSFVQGLPGGEQRLGQDQDEGERRILWRTGPIAPLSRHGCVPQALGKFGGGDEKGGQAGVPLDRRTWRLQRLQPVPHLGDHLPRVGDARRIAVDEQAQTRWR